MPFTLSHPAATLLVAPLLGRFAVPSALAVGAMAPDFPYYLGAVLPRMLTHTLSSVLWFSLPAGFLAYLLFERVLRAPLVHLLPRALRLRIEPRVALAPLLAVVISILVGATTHVVWDAFTHGSAAAVRELPMLQTAVVDFRRSPLFSYNMLQLASSLLGAAMLLVYGAAWVKRTPVRAAEQPEPLDARGRMLARSGLVAFSGLTGVAVTLISAPPLGEVASLSWLAVYAVVLTTSTGIGLLALGGLWLRLSGLPSVAAVDEGARASGAHRDSRRRIE